MKNLKWILLILVILIAIIVTVVIVNNNSKNNIVNNDNTSLQNQSSDVSTLPKSEQEGTAGSNIPLKDNVSEAKYQIEVALQHLFQETYGSDIVDARINVEKVYSAEDEKANPALAEKNLKANEVAFEVSYELKPAQGVDTNKFTVASGIYDEETGWVKEIHRLGILVPNENGEPKYKITNFSTGW